MFISDFCNVFVLYLLLLFLLKMINDGVIVLILIVGVNLVVNDFVKLLSVVLFVV